MFIALRDAPRVGQDSARQYGKNTDKDANQRNSAAADLLDHEHVNENLRAADNLKDCGAVMQQEVRHG